MQNKHFTRRAFIQSLGMGLSGLSLAGCRSMAGSIPAERIGPTDKIGVGFIGLGGMGKNRLNEFLGQEDVDVVALCDVDTRHLEESADIVRQVRGQSPQTFSHFRRLLDIPQIDAVVIVTPDHWHSIPAVLACESKKDVFVEKPLSYSVAEGRAMANAARQHERVTQMGNHIHNDLPNYRRVVERIQSGQLGRITRVHLWKTSNTKGLGNPPDTKPPKELDYDFWLGPAPLRPYNPLRSHQTYRYFWDYSGGVFIDFWCHIADIAYWALDLDAPLTISATGGRFYLQDATETPDTLQTTFEFPELLMTFTLHPNPMHGYEHMGSIGAVFIGEEATLVTNYEQHEVYIGGQKTSLPAPQVHIPDSPGHIREFLDAIKTRTLDTTCNIGYGHRLTKAGLLANIAYRTGSTLHWDDEKEEIKGNPEASRLLRRAFRAPWKAMNNE